MTGKLFQLLDCDTDGEQVGLIHCNSSLVSDSTVQYQWQVFCRDNEPNADEFIEYLRGTNLGFFERVYVAEIYN